MSRIGKMPITIPDGVEVTLNGNVITVKGPKGTITRELNPHVTVKIEDKTINVEVADEQYGNIHGLTRTLIHNMVEGVEKEFTRTLQINGVGYRAQKQGTNLVMNLGYSHQVIMEAPEGITFDVPDANTIIVRGINKEVVGQTAAVVRSKRPPEVYKGKGIKYAEEHIRRKEGKQYNPEYEYGAQVLEYNEDKSILKIGNKLNVGDKMEILIPDRITPEEFTINKMWDTETDEEIETVNPGKLGQSVKMHLPIKCETGWMIRRKK